MANRDEDAQACFLALLACVGAAAEAVFRQDEKALDAALQAMETAREQLAEADEKSKRDGGENG